MRVSECGMLERKNRSADGHSFSIFQPAASVYSCAHPPPTQRAICKLPAQPNSPVTLATTVALICPVSSQRKQSPLLAAFCVSADLITHTPASSAL